MENANVALVRRLFDGVNAGDLAATDALVSDDFVVHTSVPGIAPGREGFRAFLDVFFSAFPRQSVELHRLLADGDCVTVIHTHHVIQDGPFAGLPPTGRAAHVDGIEVFRIANGRIAEMWHQDDLLSLLTQLGALPTPSA